MNPNRISRTYLNCTTARMLVATCVLASLVSASGVEAQPCTARSSNGWDVTATQTPSWLEEVGWWDGDSFVSYLDNPVLTGSVDVCGMTQSRHWLPFDTGSPWYSDLLQYAPVDRVVTSSRPALSYEWGNVGGYVTMALGSDSIAYVDLPIGASGELLEYSPLDESRVFYAATALPTDYMNVTYGMTESTASWPVPTDISPPFTVRLDDEVLVIPVNFHVFTDPATGQVDGLPGEQMSPGYFWQQIDPGLTVSRGVAYQSASGSTTATSLASTWSPESSVILPDSVWTQCNIQFRIRSIEHTPSDQGLDDELMSNEHCAIDSCNPLGFQDAPLNEQVVDNSDEPGFHVYVGGDLGDSCAIDAAAVTCGPGSSGGGGCYLAPSPYDYVAITASGFYDAPSVLAHEFGHMLGLHHTGESCAHGDGSLMDEGYGVQDLEQAQLDEGQCHWARCIAQQWITAWDTQSYVDLGGDCSP